PSPPSLVAGAPTDDSTDADPTTSGSATTSAPPTNPPSVRSIPILLVTIGALGALSVLGAAVVWSRRDR
ncbi:MAG: hypothetical protein KDA28_00620, partial [Phycisphaerales bacterium]|nr:hypothetical protein [Phycisphaerales bacterium]